MGYCRDGKTQSVLVGERVMPFIWGVMASRYVLSGLTRMVSSWSSSQWTRSGGNGRWGNDHGTILHMSKGSGFLRSGESWDGNGFGPRIVFVDVV